MVASSVFSSGQFDRTVERAVVGGQSLVMTMSKTSSPWMVDWYERGGVHTCHSGERKMRIRTLSPALFLVLVLRSESGGVSRERERGARFGG
jgi:hypothetical protein